MKLIRLLLLTLIFLFVTGLISRAYAQTDSAPKNTLSISPPFQEVVLKEGQSEASAFITVKNSSDTPVTVSLSALNFRADDIYGKVIYFRSDSEGNETYTLAEWLELEDNVITLGPNGSAQIVAHIKNTPELRSGGHYGAVVFRVESPDLVSDDSSAPVIPGLAGLILLRKEGGSVLGLQVAQLNWPTTKWVTSIPSELEILFDNPGAVHLVPRGTVEIADMWHNTLFQGTVNENSTFVLPESKRIVRVVLKQSHFLWPVMKMTLTLNGRDDTNTGNYTQVREFYFVNPPTAIGSAILLAIIIGVLTYLIRRKQKVHLKQ